MHPLVAHSRWWPLEFSWVSDTGLGNLFVEFKMWSLKNPAVNPHWHQNTMCSDASENFEGKMILWPSYLLIGTSYTDKMPSLYWIRTQTPGRHVWLFVWLDFMMSTVVIRIMSGICTHMLIIYIYKCHKHMHSCSFPISPWIVAKVTKYIITLYVYRSIFHLNHT